MQGYMIDQTECLFNQMYYTPKERFDYAVSLLQGDAIDWWETVPDFRHQTWEVFLREFRDKYMPAIYRDEKQT